ncbi:MAG: NAD(P)-dependent alcohol dehydrogenase [Bacteroidota bacterium]|nr:NAD(P)-dependent alcohol dehydrogenase [Bacteroidota bacterium]
MKAYHIIEVNGDLIEIETLRPEEKKHFSIIKIDCCALNHRDVWIQNGKYAGLKYPIIPCSDMSGTLNGKKVIVNPGLYWGIDPKVQSSEFEILGLPSPGSLAEYISVPDEHIFEYPVFLDPVHAAALPLAGLTAYRALFTKTEPIKQEKILITGIGGGVALMLLQFSLASGLECYVSSSSDEKIDKALKLGAKAGFNYTTFEWEKAAQKISGGFDIILDGAAGSHTGKLIKLCKPGARICFYGGTDGNMMDLSPQQIFWKQLKIFGSTMGTNEEFKAMLHFVAKHKISPVVDEVYPFSKVNNAFKKMASGQQFGKLVVKVSE